MIFVYVRFFLVNIHWKGKPETFLRDCGGRQRSFSLIFETLIKTEISTRKLCGIVLDSFHFFDYLSSVRISSNTSMF